MIIVRYVAVQLVAYAVEMASFALMFEGLHFDLINSNIFSKIIAGLLAFFAHRFFTFQIERKPIIGVQAFKYFLLLGLNIPVSSLFLWTFTRILPSPIISKLFADLLCIGLTYIISKKLVFTSATSEIKKA
jgi:putative flippase GtrA